MSKFRVRSLLALAGILITIGGCAESPSPVAVDAAWQKISRPAGPSFSRSGEDSPTSKLIGPEGGSIQNGGHKLVFPAGALSEPTVITMSTDAEYVGVHLEPHGLQFPAGREPVLTLDYSGADTSVFSSLSVVYVDDAGTIQEVLPTKELGGGGKLRANLEHFSGYIGAGS